MVKASPGIASSTIAMKQQINKLKLVNVDQKTLSKFNMLYSALVDYGTANDNAISTLNNGTKFDVQSDVDFNTGSEYVMYFSGVNGFTEYHPYDAPAAFVDLKASITIYNQNNEVVFTNPDIFSSYIGGQPLADAKYLTMRVKLNSSFKKGIYRWESVVTDDKDSGKVLKGVVNFVVN